MPISTGTHSPTPHGRVQRRWARRSAPGSGGPGRTEPGRSRGLQRGFRPADRGRSRKSGDLLQREREPTGSGVSRTATRIQPRPSGKSLATPDREATGMQPDPDVGDPMSSSANEADGSGATRTVRRRVRLASRYARSPARSVAQASASVRAAGDEVAMHAVSAGAETGHGGCAAASSAMTSGAAST